MDIVAFLESSMLPIFIEYSPLQVTGMTDARRLTMRRGSVCL